jgi:signal transduction histidine kinase
MAGFEGIFFTYFIYGLAFFSMGLVLLVESVRTPSREQMGLVLPLAFFGILHGIHEWLDIYMLHSVRLGESFPAWMDWFRLGLLSASFLALWVYGIIAFKIMRAFRSPLIYFGLISLPIYVLLIGADLFSALNAGRISVFQLTNGMARYLLAVPGAAVTTLGLRAGGNRAAHFGRKPLDRYLNWAAVGFALYSLTQLFVPNMNTLFAQVLNAEDFQRLFGVPIQGLRTLVALMITISLFLVTQFLEQERQVELAKAQQAQLEAVQKQEALQLDLLRHTISAQEDERGRISRELHDEMAQLLTAFSFDLAAVQNSLPGRFKAQASLERLDDLRRQMSENIQRMVYDLRPAHLDELGLVKALEYLCDRSQSRLNLQPKFATRGTPVHLAADVETALFRIVQEALTNISRHAHTQEVSVCLDYQPEAVMLTISDHGVGFDMAAEQHGWGLIGMHERAKAFGGTFEIQSAPGAGTTLTANIPIQARSLR